MHYDWYTIWGLTDERLMGIVVRLHDVGGDSPSIRDRVTPCPSPFTDGSELPR